VQRHLAGGVQQRLRSSSHAPHQQWNPLDRALSYGIERLAIDSRECDALKPQGRWKKGAVEMDFRMEKNGARMGM
jgi:hypothetical protein